MALDPVTSDELRLDRRQLLVLGRLATPPDGDAEAVRDPTRPDVRVTAPVPEEIDSLRAAGLIDGDQPHPNVAALAAAVADPVVRLVIERVAPPPAVRCPGWISSSVAVLALPQPQGPDKILAVPVSELVLHLAALISLGPRLPAATPPAPAQIRLSFRISASWYGPGGVPTERRVSGADAGEEGWWLEEAGTGELAPVSATTVFRHLTTLLPDDAELG